MADSALPFAACAIADDSSVDLAGINDPGAASTSIHGDPDTSDELELTVVMPCLDEELTLPVCIQKSLAAMQRLGIAGEVLIVDNGSTDRSVAVATAAGARVVYQSLRGYGNALRCGFDAARGRFILMGDCDDSYDFGELGRFVERLRAGADMVMGNRLRGEIKPGAMPPLHRWVGNPVLSGILNFLFHTGVGDCHCGMRAFRRAAYRRMNLQMPGMELASEMVIKAARAGLKIDEIPITLWPDGRDRPPHLRSFRDGWRHLRFMLLCSPTFLFVIPGLVLTLLGLFAIPAVVLAGYGAFTDRLGPNFMFTAALAAIGGWHLLVFGFLAKFYAHRVDPVFADPRVERIARFFSVERGLVHGISLMLAAATIAIPVFVAWLQTAEVFSPAQWIFAGTLFVLGLETLFASLLVGVLDLSQESKRTG